MGPKAEGEQKFVVFVGSKGSVQRGESETEVRERVSPGNEHNKIIIKRLPLIIKQGPNPRTPRK